MHPSYPTADVAATALANQLSESRTQMSVEFPCTGDPELDAICGITQVLAKLGQHSQAAVRVLEYVAQRHKDEIAAIHRISEIAQGLTAPLPPKQWTSTDGTVAAPAHYDFQAKMTSASNPCNGLHDLSPFDKTFLPRE